MDSSERKAFQAGSPKVTMAELSGVELEDLIFTAIRTVGEDLKSLPGFKPIDEQVEVTVDTAHFRASEPSRKVTHLVEGGGLLLEVERSTPCAILAITRAVRGDTSYLAEGLWLTRRAKILKAEVSWIETRDEPGTSDGPQGSHAQIVGLVVAECTNLGQLLVRDPKLVQYMILYLRQFVLAGVRQRQEQVTSWTTKAERLYQQVERVAW
jgi:hypothetical protein